MTKAAELAKMGEVLTNSQIGGRRNVAYNGAMQISQRGTSFTGKTSDTFCVDRFVVAIGSGGTWTITQETDAPSGFAKSLKVNCTATGATGGANSVIIRQKLEGQDLQHLKKGTSDAEKVTLSFYVKSNVTGTYQINIRDLDNNRIIGATYAISSASTWEKKTITFEGDTTGTLDNDNAQSFFLDWWLHGGSSYTGGAVPTSWETKSDTDQFAGSTVVLGDTTGNTFQITGVQLEVGEQATPFEHRSFGEELALCQRYFQQSNKGESANESVGNGLANLETSSAAEFHWTLKGEMRAIPTIAKTGAIIVRENGANKTVSSIQTIVYAKDRVWITLDISGGTDEATARVYTAGTETALTADAEL